MKLRPSMVLQAAMGLLLLVGALGLEIFEIKLVFASAYTDALSRPAWFQNREPQPIPQPGGSGPSGWSPVAPDNSPEPAQPDTPPDPTVEETTTVVQGLTLSTSAALIDGNRLPKKYTCEGNNISMPLSWVVSTEEVLTSTVEPQDVQLGSIGSFLLSMVDEAGAGMWEVYNLAPNTTGISEGVPKTEFWAGFYQAQNEFGGVGYTGPCPNDNLPHTYYLTLTALDQQFAFPDPTAVTFQNVIAATVSHVLMAANLEVTYIKGSSDTPGASTFQLQSEDFVENGLIPTQFTCDGNNVSPQLSWTGAPAGTVNFALLMTDTSADNFSHWGARFPVRRTSINRGVPQGLQPGGDMPDLYQSLNGFGNLGYDGPCPPAFDGVHNYKFELLALNTTLAFADPSKVTDADVRNAALGHILGTAVLAGRYERKEGGGSGIFTLTSPDFVDGGNLPQTSKGDFDILTEGFQCVQAPVNADRFATTSDFPGLEDCAADSPARCKNGDIVYICPGGVGACAVDERIPELLIRGTMDTADPGQSPALEWTNVPAGTAALAVLITDDDLVGNGTINFDNNESAHMVGYNIPPDIDTLDPDQGKNFYTGVFFQGFNDVWWRDSAATRDSPYGDGALDLREDVGYWGACLVGHRIAFTLAALDQVLTFDDVESVTYSAVVNAMRGHIIGTAQIVGTVPQ